MMCEQAAIKIQATWRGYNTRREVERMRGQQEIAAMKIQVRMQKWNLIIIKD